MNESVYQVFAQVDNIDDSGQPWQESVFIGTAWAIGDHLLATNAHVAAAFQEAAEAGTQFSRAVAVQSGTGEVVRLLREVTHPSYSDDPLRSPDVALLTTQDRLPSWLELAPADSVLDLGDEFHLSGFPGDVDEFITSRPGETVPQATTLSGSISARRAHSDDQVVSPETLAVYQHQAPTTPGTSGSPMMHCGLVFGINNAGTVNLVVSPESNGEYTVERQAAAANNFGVHVRFIHELLELFEANAVEGSPLPAPAVAQAPVADDPPGDEPAAEALTFAGVVTDSHEFSFALDVETGELSGTADWPSGATFTLSGALAPQETEGVWQFSMVDDAPERNPETARGYYVGEIADDGSFYGYYYETEDQSFYFEGALQQ